MPEAKTAGFWEDCAAIRGRKFTRMYISGQKSTSITFKPRAAYAALFHVRFHVRFHVPSPAVCLTNLKGIGRVWIKSAGH
jgi:hypothetical protein